MEEPTKDKLPVVEPKPEPTSPTPAPVPSSVSVSQPSPAPVSPGDAASASTHGLNGPMPDELKRWSWAAFLMSWIWAIAHNAWIVVALGLLTFACNFLWLFPEQGVYTFVWYVISTGLGFVGGLILAIYLGVKGNELAWEHRKFESVEQFKRVQRIWMYWGLGLLVAMILVVAAYMLMGVLMYVNSYTEMRYEDHLNNPNVVSELYNSGGSYDYDPYQIQ